MDDRETTSSTQRGTFCAFLFREDMSGVYLTLNQGAAITIKESGRIEGRRILRKQVETMRQIAGPQLQSFTLQLDQPWQNIHAELCALLAAPGRQGASSLPLAV
jgi:hypothetical protein